MNNYFGTTFIFIILQLIYVSMMVEQDNSISLILIVSALQYMFYFFILNRYKQYKHSQSKGIEDLEKLIKKPKGRWDR